MLLHRITWVADDWRDQRAIAPYHPLFVPTSLQGAGRFDNPTRYGAMYAAHTPQAAIGEVFGDLSIWTSNAFDYRRRENSRCLVTYELDDDRSLLDLDDAATLGALALRPTDVVKRNRERTQEVALQLWLDRERSGHAGLTWWSFWRPDWTVSMLWSDDLANSFNGLTVVDAEPLASDHPAVVIAAEILHRKITS